MVKDVQPSKIILRFVRFETRKQLRYCRFCGVLFSTTDSEDECQECSAEYDAVIHAVYKCS